MTPGHLYVIHTTLASPPKDKLTICICAADTLFVWINTEARRHGVGQFPLKKGDHSALSHDCHLDLSRVTTFPPRELSKALDRGVISSDLADRILRALKAAPPKTLPPRHLRLIVQCLEGLVP